MVKRPATLGFVSATVVLAAAAMAAYWTGPPDATVAFWLGACLLGEALWARLPVGNATVSMAIACNFGCMLVLPPGHALAVVALSTLVGEALTMRKPPVRLLFNAAQSTLATAAGCAVLTGASLADSARMPWAVFALAAAAYVGVNTAFVSLVIALDERLPAHRVWRQNFGTAFELLSNGTLFSLGVLLALTYTRVGPQATALLLLPLLFVFFGYRLHGARRDALEEESSKAA